MTYVGINQGCENEDAAATVTNMRRAVVGALDETEGIGRM